MDGWTGIATGTGVAISGEGGDEPNWKRAPHRGQIRAATPLKESAGKRCVHAGFGHGNPAAMAATLHAIDSIDDTTHLNDTRPAPPKRVSCSLRYDDSE